MGDIRQPAPVLLITSAFSRHGAALEWAARRTIQGWGPIALISPQFDFVETDYYEPTMGPGLKKIFFAYENLLTPADLARVKIEANQWELDYANVSDHAEERPLNLDPGYITPAKVVLASTKDHSHRLYLDDGIYGEVTLKFSQGKWRERDWTFPDYRREDYHAFFTECRQYLRERQREGPE